MSTDAHKAQGKPPVTVSAARVEEAQEIAGDLFQIVDESEAAALMQTRGNFDLSGFWKDINEPHGPKKETLLGKHVFLNLNGFVKKYCPESAGTKHLNTNVQKKLRDFLGVNVAVRKVKGIDTIILKVPLKLPEEGKKGEKAKK
jgi:hypothetical protein